MVLALVALAGAAHAMPPQVRDCSDCAPVALLPAGQFIMGADGGEPGRPDGPPHLVRIERPFGLAVTEVTNAQFARFVKATGAADADGCEVWPKGAVPFEKARWQDPGYGRAPLPDEPVACVSWNEASAYAAWLAKETGKPYRLPSEAEWEYAARAGTVTAYWWGDEAGSGNANCRDCGSGHEHETAPVGSFRPNPFGLHDMNGNVWEWTADCWRPHHAAPPERSRDGTCPAHVVKGGSWYYFPPMSRPAARARNDVRTNSYNIGFRIARDLD